MAERYGIAFSLLEDKELALAKQWAGVSSDGYPLPSMYILRPDGSVYLRRIGDAKNDRIYVPELLGHLDAMLGHDSSSMTKPRGFARPNRISANLGLGGHTLDENAGFATDLSIRALRTLGNHLGFGAEVGGLALPDAELRAALLAQAHVPMHAGVGEFYLQLPVGWAKRFSDDELGSSGVFLGARLGLSFDVNPNVQLIVELAVEATRISAPASALSARSLLRAAAAWRF